MSSRKLITGITAEGSVNLMIGQLKFMKEQGYDTYLLSPHSERSAKYCSNEGCKHLIVPLEREISILSDLLNLFRIIGIFLRTRPDIINLGTPKVSLLGMIAGKFCGVKTRIYTCRGFRFEHETGLKRKILVTMERITSKLSHRVICISPSVKEFGVSEGIFPAEKAVVINKGSSNGVDLELFQKEKYGDKLLERLRIELGIEDKFTFGFVGRVVDRKGINELYKAFSNLYEVDQNIALIIIGPIEGEQLKDKSLLKKLEEHEGIYLLGKKSQTEIPLYLAIQDVFVLPAWWEGFGNVLIQAAAMGIPVISTYGTGTRDAVKEQFNGLLVPVKDESALYKAMFKLYSEQSYAKELGTNGMGWAQNFKREVIWDRMNELFKQEFGDVS